MALSCNCPAFVLVEVVIIVIDNDKRPQSLVFTAVSVGFECDAYGIRVPSFDANPTL